MFWHCLPDTLDTDYIARFLGALSPYEESTLVQLRRVLQASHKGKVRHTLRQTHTHRVDDVTYRPMIGDDIGRTYATAVYTCVCDQWV